MRKISSCFVIYILYICVLLFTFSVSKASESSKDYLGESLFEIVMINLEEEDEQSDTVRTPQSTPVLVNVYELLYIDIEEVRECRNYSIIISSGPSNGSATVENNNIKYIPVTRYVGYDEIYYTFTCNSGFTLDCKLVINVTEYSIPLNFIPKETPCLVPMDPVENFTPELKYKNESVRVNGFSIPLIGDLNNDGKPEIIGLGLGPCSTSGDCGNDINARASNIIIYDGQDGSVLVNFNLRQRLGYAEVNTSDDSKTQFKLRTFPFHSSPCNIAIADVDRDGLGEIIVAETGAKGRVYALKTVVDANNKIVDLSKMWDADLPHRSPYDSYRNPYAGYTQEIFGEPMPYISDLNADGIPEIIIYNKIYNAITGKLILELEEIRSYETYTNTAVIQQQRKDFAYVGIRHGPIQTENCLPVISIIDIDNDGVMEIIAGSKVYSLNITNTAGTGGNTYNVTHGPSQVTLNCNGTNRTFYLNDGFTTVADIDGDNELDIIVQANSSNNWGSDYSSIIWVWNYSSPNVVKAATAYKAASGGGTASIQFVGDVNGRFDDITGTKKLPEICITTGVLWYLNNSYTNVKFHPLSSSELSSNSNRFNSTASRSFHMGHIFALTYHGDENTPVGERLKLSWAMEHNDESASTGITMFDFDNDGVMELCYRDEKTLRIISPAMQTYIRLDEAITSPAIRFRFSDLKSYTGFEASVIADVNMDGSADIISFCYPRSDGGDVRSYGYPYVFQNAAGSELWAPAPPVWNQGIYFPLQINADLTVPTRPISTLTEIESRNPGEYIKPYNGNWIQQPIVKEDDVYIPVRRLPDAEIVQIIPHIDVQEVTITIRNKGSASINANTPISFYLDELNTSPILTVPIGVDIFPNEVVTKRYSNFQSPIQSLQKIWARVVDDGSGTFPAAGYKDCEINNNAMYGVDCPDFIVHITSFVDTIICGEKGYVKLEITDPDQYGEDASFQWYKDDIEIEGASEYIYITTETGKYKVFVSSGLCKKFSEETIELVLDPTEEIAEPDIRINPPGQVICGPNGFVILTLVNVQDYDNATFQWYLGFQPILEATEASLIAMQPGDYRLRIVKEDCMTYSEIITISASDDQRDPPVISSIPADGGIYNNTPVKLFLTNPDDFAQPTFRWYKNMTDYVANDSVLLTLEVGNYHLVVEDEGCAFLSNSIEVKIGQCIDPTFDYTNFYICKGDMVNLLSTVSNISVNSEVKCYSDAQCIWLMNNIIPENGLMETKTFYLRARDITSNCQSPIFPMTVTVYEKPTLTLHTPFTEFCEGDTLWVDLTFTGNVPWIYKVNDGTSIIEYTSNNNHSLYTKVIYENTTFDFFDVTDNYCTSNENDLLRVTVIPYPGRAGLSDGDYVWIGNKLSSDPIRKKSWFEPTNWRVISGSDYIVAQISPDFSNNVYLIESESCVHSKEVVITENLAKSNNLYIDNGYKLLLNENHLDVKGSFINKGVFNSGTGEVSFTGNTLQEINTNGYKFYDVDFNNTIGGMAYSFQLMDDFTVSNSAEFINGVLNSNDNKIIIADNAICNQGNSNSFVDGEIRKVGDNSFIFPTGDIVYRDMGGSLKPFKIWAPFEMFPTEDGIVTVEYKYSNENLPEWWYHDWTHEYPLTHVSDREYWFVESNVSFSNYNLYWKNNNPCSVHDFCNRFDGTFLDDMLTTTHWDGSKWVYDGGVPVGDYENGNIMSTSSDIYFGVVVSTFFTFGATGSELPLPVELIDFGVACNGHATINWITATETNSDYFILEKSNEENLINFVEIFRTPSARNSNTFKYYQYIDENISKGNNYYRLKQVDLDGNVITYHIIKTECKESIPNTCEISIFPNPTNSEINITLENFNDEYVLFELFNELGSKYISKKYNVTDNSSQTFMIDLSKLEPSIYYLKTSSLQHFFIDKIMFFSK